MNIAAAADKVRTETENLLMHNSLEAWGGALGMLLITLIVIFIVKWIAINRLDALAKRTSIAFDDAIVSALRATYLLLLFFPALAISANSLDLPKRLTSALAIVATLAFFTQAGIWLNAIAGYLVNNSRQRALETNAAAATSLAAIGFMSKLLIWTLVLLLALDNIGVDVTALVAGLGVGGVAVALALQNILGDLFASLSIIIDKPFEIGDFIIVDSLMGSVEHIGLKTTRLRSLGGEQIIFSNSDLLSARTRNYKRMYERRVVFGFGVLYQTPIEQMEKIPATVRNIIENIEHTRFDRAHFLKFGDSSLDFEVVYWVLSPDYNLYMDIQQEINLSLMRNFEGEGIVFAYPSRSLYVEAPVSVRLERTPGGEIDKNYPPD